MTPLQIEWQRLFIYRFPCYASDANRSSSKFEPLGGQPSITLLVVGKHAPDPYLPSRWWCTRAGNRSLDGFVHKLWPDRFLIQRQFTQ